MTEYTKTPFMISPPGVTDMELLFCNPKHRNNMYMVNHYLEVLDKWLDTHPFTEAGAAQLPDDPVVQLVNDALLQKLDPDDPNNFIKIRYHDYNNNIYVLCNHELACRLLIIGYELDENLMDHEEETSSFPQEIDAE